MTREEKNQFIEALNTVLTDNNNFCLADISNLSASESSDLRRLCFKRDVSLKVVKNNLLKKAFEKSHTKFFIISFTSDWLYPTSENRDIVIALNAIGKNVGFVEISSDKGHDSFLLDVPDFLNTVKNFLNTSYENIK